MFSSLQIVRVIAHVVECIDQRVCETGDTNIICVGDTVGCFSCEECNSGNKCDVTSPPPDNCIAIETEEPYEEDDDNGLTPLIVGLSATGAIFLIGTLGLLLYRSQRSLRDSKMNDASSKADSSKDTTEWQP